MNKRIMIVICIIIAALSFMGGMVYKYEGILNIVEFDFEKDKFTYDFLMPMDLETASIWLDWAIDFHQYHIDNNPNMKQKQFEEYQGYIDMYNKIKVLFLEFEEGIE